MKTVNELKAAIENEKARSAWDKGVKMYALEILEDLPENYEIYGEKSDRELLLNGARSWSQYSWGGSSLIYDADITERLCTPSELKKTRNGERRPNNSEEWLDVQARALTQACNMVCRLARRGATA